MPRAAASSTAASPSDPGPAPAYDPAQHYEVQLARIVEWNGDLYSPGKHTVLRGDVCEALKDAIASAQPV